MTLVGYNLRNRRQFSDGDQVAIQAEKLKSLIKQELKALDFDFDETGNLVLSNNDKDTIRNLHASSRQIELENSQEWIQRALEKYRDFFADGVEITPRNIKPSLILVTEQWQHDLFRLARYTWALPYSQGFGRRMRYLLIDESNEKLIGRWVIWSVDEVKHWISINYSVTHTRHLMLLRVSIHL